MLSFRLLFIDSCSFHPVGGGPLGAWGVVLKDQRILLCFRHCQWTKWTICLLNMCAALFQKYVEGLVAINDSFQFILKGDSWIHSIFIYIYIYVCISHYQLVPKVLLLCGDRGIFFNLQKGFPYSQKLSSLAFQVSINFHVILGFLFSVDLIFSSWPQSLLQSSLFL